MLSLLSCANKKLYASWIVLWMCMVCCAVCTQKSHVAYHIFEVAQYKMRQSSTFILCKSLNNITINSIDLLINVTNLATSFKLNSMLNGSNNSPAIEQRFFFIQIFQVYLQNSNENKLNERIDIDKKKNQKCNGNKWTNFVSLKIDELSLFNWLECSTQLFGVFVKAK